MVLNPPLFKNSRFRPAAKKELFFSRRFLGHLSKSDVGGPMALLNLQKLSLPANTAVGTQVAVTDGFVVSGDPSPSAAGVVTDGFYSPTGNSFGGKAVYYRAPGLLGDFTNNFFVYASNHWILTDTQDDQGDIGGEAGVGNEANPWQADWSGVTPPLTLTHPAIQQLAALSTAQGGVFVSGGTQDGVYSKRGTNEGKDYFELLGVSDPDPTVTRSIYWTADPGKWFIVFDGDPIYYSLSDVADPSLASDWRNASDDSPASITVTSVTTGQLVSGWKLNDVTRVVNGNLNGRNLYSDVLGVAPNLSFNGTHWSDGTTTGTLNTAFPDIGTADPVASEANWSIVP